MMIPQVKNYVGGEDSVCFPHLLTVYLEPEYREKGVALLRLLLPGCEISQQEEAVIVGVKTENYSDNPERYALRIVPGKITVEYSAYIGLRNAFACLSLLARWEEEGVSFPGCSIEDYPVAEHRGVMLDLARGTKDFDTLKADMVFMAQARMNRLHLHLNDSNGVCFAMDSFPAEYRIDRAYTKAQMQEIVHLADILGLEIIPEWELPGHATKLLEVFPSLVCEVPGKSKDELSRWVVCAGAEEVYGLAEKAVKEITELFPGKYFHIGGDELELADIPGLKYRCHWQECSRCRALMERERLKDRQELYYRFIRRIAKTVQSYGRQVIMWSDQVDCLRPADLPKDIIFHFWRIAAEGRGPVDGCSMDAQLKMGHSVINSHYLDTYLIEEEHISPERLADWHWQKRPECDSESADAIMGSELCLWEYGNAKDFPHYSRTVPPAVFLFGDKLWNGKNLVYSDDYKKALTKAILGIKTPKNLNIFSCIGAVLPPRMSDKKVYEERITAGQEELEATKTALKKMADAGNGLAAVYWDAIASV